MGGFRELPLLEDVELVERLQKRGPPAIVMQPMAVSGRRWKQLGLLRTMLTNQLVLVGWRLGVPVQGLARWYYCNGKRKVDWMTYKHS
jgi:hypothetical protein